jgi:hypothetical protein
MSKASESSNAAIQNLLAQKDIAERDGDATATAAIQQQITDLGYT